ncbi:MAG: glycosyltransferase family 39 protein [Caldilineaceae bacterium]|nr:glycosyltransferase family 39 protein [Caldilineaceae bacterium]
MRRFFPPLQNTAWLALLFFFVAIAIYSPILLQQDLDYDEGINLMKALLFQRGYALYTEIWSDQPPLLTALLAGWFALVGDSVLAGRVLILAFAAGLVWTMHNALYRHTSGLAALGAVALLLFSQEFIRLSSSVMIGLPALALAMVALWLLLRYRDTDRGIWLALSAIAMACAAQIKLWAVVAVPAALLYLLLSDAARPHAVRISRRTLLETVGWLIVTGIGYVVIGFVFGALRMDQLIAPHFDADTRTAFLYTNNLLYLRYAMQRHIPYLLLALVGVIWAARWRQMEIILPLVWFGASVVALAVQRPLWHHHITLFTIPLCWLSAYGIQAGVQVVQSIAQTPQKSRGEILRTYGLCVLATGFLIAILFYPAPIYALIRQESHSNLPIYNRQMVDHLRQDVQSAPGIIFTDRPFYAFQVHALTPPETAVISRKRLQSGDITDDMLVQMLEKYAPPYLVLERFTSIYGENFLRMVHDRYSLRFEVDSSQYYVLNY